MKNSIRIRVIEYKGEDYRDDRMFVINLSHGKEGDVPKWILTTYRNTVRLITSKTNCFDTKEEAIDYLKSVEGNFFTPKTCFRDIYMPNPEICLWQKTICIYHGGCGGPRLYSREKPPVI